MINRFQPIKITDILPYYYASTEGRIYVLHEKDERFSFKELKPIFPDKKFRMKYVTLSFTDHREIVRKLIPVHWLIASTFLGNHELGYKVFFIDNNMENTNVENLCWRIDRNRKNKLLNKIIWRKELMTSDAIKLIKLRDDNN